MFAKLKKKIAEEAATAPRSGVRIPRTISKESITSVGADSGDDFASDGSSSRDDLSAQLLRRNHQIRKLEAKLSDYAEQLRIMQKTKEKLEIALERHQDSSIKKLQEQSESHQANRTKMAEGMAVALEKKDQEWMEKLAALEREKSALSAQLEEMMKQSLTLFQKRDDLDELDGFQQQELAKVKEELLLLQEEDEQKVSELEARCQELQSVIQQVSEDFQMVSAKLEHIWLSYCLVWCLSRQAAVTEEDKERLLVEFQKKVSSLERRLQGNLSQDEHLQELLQEKSSLEMSLENTRAELLSVRTNHADTVSSLEAQVSRMSCSISDLQNLLRHKEDSSRAYRERTDTQVGQNSTSYSEFSCRSNSGYHTGLPVGNLLSDRTPEWICIRTLDFLPQVELNSQLMVSADISRSLDETRRQKEDLQAQVSTCTPAGHLHMNAHLKPFECDGITEILFAFVVQISYLEVEVETLTEQLQTPEVCEEDQNGSVTVDDLDHIQRINRDLEQQLGDKNRTIKQLQQRLAEMRRTLQKELKLKPEVEAEGKEKPEPVCPEPPSTPAPSPPTSRTTVTNTSDLNDSREINFEYLKHVVLKFMSSRDAEAYQLIRAVSVLLSFTREEEEMLKQTLEYKMSWFGSKPSPKGIIRPSISGASTHWS
uniref:Golgin subfamily A member 1 n=1 Tax=Nothobranchius furzeri TaxID=105023 RepID=A0A8C6LXI8_NOTFU